MLEKQFEKRLDSVQTVCGVREDFIRSNPDARELKRALAVKLVKAGKSYREIVGLLNVSISSRRSYYDLFKLAGISWKKTQNKTPSKTQLSWQQTSGDKKT